MDIQSITSKKITDLTYKLHQELVVYDKDFLMENAFKMALNLLNLENEPLINQSIFVITGSEDEVINEEKRLHYRTLTRLELTNELIAMTTNKDIVKEIDIIKYLISSKELLIHADVNDSEMLFMVCEHGNLEILQLIVENKNFTTYSAFNNIQSFDNNNIAHSFSPLSCLFRSKNKDAVKYVLTHPQIKKHLDITQKDNIALKGACDIQDFEMINFLLTSPELPIHPDLHFNNDALFKKLCESSNLEVINYFIFEYDIEKTNAIRTILKEYPDIDLLFQNRELNKRLNIDLKGSKEKDKDKGRSKI